jgi:hypothetical protein
MSHRRRLYTGEASRAAALGVSREGHGIGLDDCTPAQRRLRFLLALGVFNQGALQASPGEWTVAGISSYDLVLSPRFDDLAVVCRTPYNAVCWLVPDGRAVRVPGLRLQEQIGGTYLLRHLVCGTSMSVTAEPSTRPDSGDLYGNGRDRLWSTRTPVTEAEWDLLESLPSVTPAAEALLAGLLVRLCLRDPAAGWAIGQFSDDPLGRLERGVPRQGFRRLWGAGNRWELAWCSYPFPGDLVQALVDPLVGIPGAYSTSVRRGWDIRLEDAVLALRPSAG